MIQSIIETIFQFKYLKEWILRECLLRVIDSAISFTIFELPWLLFILIANSIKSLSNYILYLTHFNYLSYNMIHKRIIQG